MTQFTISHDGRSLQWTGGGEYLRIEPWGANSVRVRARRMHEPLDDDGALLPQPAATPIAAGASAPPAHSAAECCTSSFTDGGAEAHAGGRMRCGIDTGVDADADASAVAIDIAANDDGSVAELRNGDLLVRARSISWRSCASGYEEYRCELSFLKADGTLLLREIPVGGSLNLKARDYRALPGGAHAITVSFESPEGEHLYGMGEYQQSVLDLKGSTLELAHRNSQCSVPFVVSSAGYGFLWHNPAVGRVTFARNRTEWHADAAQQVDYWVTAGDTPAQIEAQYADATGHAPVMPEWGLGFWQCKLRYWNQEQLLEVARGFKRRGIPLDLIVVDFFHWPLMGDFRFDEEFWPDPRAMADELHAMGVKLMVSVWPQIALESEHYADMKAHNLLVSAERGEDLGMMFEGPSQYYDATNPAARRYVWDLCRANYADLGVDAFWLDEAEPEYGSYDFDNYRYYAGPNVQIGNIYPRDYNRGFYEGQLAMGREGEIVNLTRCAWAGSQRYGALVWSGDVGSTFGDLKAQITCAIHMGMAGIPWFTTDMGGFHDGDIDSPLFRELFVRWAQFSCFSPVMRNHGDRSALQPDGTTKERVTGSDGVRRSPSGAGNEPWSMGERVERILVKFIRLRELLRPYTRELFDQAHTAGQPLMRGLFYEFPSDPAAADIADEYLFGPDLLVAPVTEAGATSRAVYLPGGGDVQWVDLRDGTAHPGGTTIMAAAPLDTLPVFARDGRDHGLLGRL